MKRRDFDFSRYDAPKCPYCNDVLGDEPTEHIKRAIDVNFPKNYLDSDHPFKITCSNCENVYEIIDVIPTPMATIFQTKKYIKRSANAVSST